MLKGMPQPTGKYLYHATDFNQIDLITAGLMNRLARLLLKYMFYKKSA